MPFFCGGKLTIFLMDTASLQKQKYKKVTNVIVHIKPGTIKEFTSIRPSVPRSRKKIAIESIMSEPNIFGIPKNWFIKAPLPASIMDALEIKNKVVINPVNFPNKFGLIMFITSL